VVTTKPKVKKTLKETINDAAGKALTGGISGAMAMTV
jgi:hypothetical protein